MHRLVIISILIGLVIDYSIRLFGTQSYILISSANQCFCWLFIYHSYVYASIFACLSAAVVRILCVKYPMDYESLKVGAKIKSLLGEKQILRLVCTSRKSSATQIQINLLCSMLERELFNIWKHERAKNKDIEKFVLNY